MRSENKEVEIFALDFDGFARIEDYYPRLPQDKKRVDPTVDEAKERAKWLVDVYTCALRGHPGKVKLKMRRGKEVKEFTQNELLSKFVFFNDLKESLDNNRDIQITIGSNRQNVVLDRSNTVGENEKGEYERHFIFTCRKCLSLLQKVIDDDSFSSEELIQEQYLDTAVFKISRMIYKNKVTDEKKTIKVVTLKTMPEQWKTIPEGEYDKQDLKCWRQLKDKDGKLPIERLTHAMMEQLNCHDLSGYKDKNKVLQNILQMHAVAATNPGKEIIFNFQDDKEKITDVLEGVFSTYPQMIPKGMKVKITQQKEPGVAPVIKQEIPGTGRVIELEEMQDIIRRLDNYFHSNYNKRVLDKDASDEENYVRYFDYHQKKKIIDEIGKYCRERPRSLFYGYLSGVDNRIKALNEKLTSMTLEDVEVVKTLSDHDYSTQELYSSASQLSKRQLESPTSEQNIESHLQGMIAKQLRELKGGRSEINTDVQMEDLEEKDLRAIYRYTQIFDDRQGVRPSEAKLQKLKDHITALNSKAQQEIQTGNKNRTGSKHLAGPEGSASNASRLGTDKH